MYYILCVLYIYIYSFFIFFSSCSFGFKFLKFLCFILFCRRCFKCIGSQAFMESFCQKNEDSVLLTLKFITADSVRRHFDFRGTVTQLSY